MVRAPRDYQLTAIPSRADRAVDARSRTIPPDRLPRLHGPASDGLCQLLTMVPLLVRFRAPCSDEILAWVICVITRG